MATTQDFIRSAAAKPKIIRELFEEAWSSVAARFGNHPNDIENARMRLAMIALDLAEDDQFGPLQITRTASRLMRQAPREVRQSP